MQYEIKIYFPRADKKFGQPCVHHPWAALPLPPQRRRSVFIRPCLDVLFLCGRLVPRGARPTADRPFSVCEHTHTHTFSPPLAAVFFGSVSVWARVTTILILSCRDCRSHDGSRFCGARRPYDSAPLPSTEKKRIHTYIIRIREKYARRRRGTLAKSHRRVCIYTI